MSVILRAGGKIWNCQVLKFYGRLHRCFLRGTIDQKGNSLREKPLPFAIRCAPLRSIRRQVW